MEVGIVGLPYTGKSTLFRAFTGLEPDPGAGLKPNIGVARIPDPRLDTLVRLVETKKVVPASLTVLDIPGLVRGSSEGAGMGNAFLSHIRDVDALIHVVRCFTKGPGGQDVAHVDGSLDPMRDIETIELELILADLQMVENALPRAEKAARRRDAEAVARLSVLRKAMPILESGEPARSLAVGTEDERKALKGLAMLSKQPVLYVANVDEDDADGTGELAARVRAHAENVHSQFIPVCALIEAEIAELDESDRGEMLESLGLTEPALHKLAQAAYALLGLQSFYTVGPKEIRAWTVPVGATGPQAAGVIHTDFERGFIRVEVHSVDELDQFKTEKAIREAGKMRVEGKHYVMRDADVCHFLFNV